MKHTKPTTQDEEKEFMDRAIELIVENRVLRTEFLERLARSLSECDCAAYYRCSHHK